MTTSKYAVASGAPDSMVEGHSLATFFGLLAILSWSPAALILSYLTHLPVMLVLTVSFSVCFGIVALKLTLSQQWSLCRGTPWGMWLAGIGGIFGNNVCCLLALKHAPAAHVVLIGYLWPITVLFMSSLFLQQPIRRRQWLAALIAFCGVGVLILQGDTMTAKMPHVLWGYLLAFASGTLWAIYCVASKAYHQTRGEMVGLYCGVAALLSFILYWFFAQAVMLTSVEVSLMVLLGLTALGLAFLFWDYGIKRGNFKFLCISAFFIPLLSTCLLVLFGKATPTSTLWFTLACVTLGSYLARE